MHSRNILESFRFAFSGLRYALRTQHNTCIHLVSPGYYPLVKVVKDVMAGAVLLTAAVSVIAGLLVLGPPLWTRMFGD
jgi:diacylglycerol kinase